jgi:hypothetical protein
MNPSYLYHAFGDDKTLTVDHDGKEIIINDPEQNAKVTFYIGDWGRWEHTMEAMED